MATGLVGIVSNGTLSYTPQSNSKLNINWYSTGAANITINGTTAFPIGASGGSGVIPLYCAAGLPITIGSSASVLTLTLSALEENS